MAGLMGTDKLHAEESEAYFRVLIESAPDAMVIVDVDGETKRKAAEKDKEKKTVKDISKVFVSDPLKRQEQT